MTEKRRWKIAKASYPGINTGLDQSPAYTVEKVEGPDTGWPGPPTTEPPPHDDEHGWIEVEEVVPADQSEKE